MRGGFMLADASPVDIVIDEPSISVEGIDVAVVPLKGHSPNQVGFLVDDIFFCADIVLPASVLEKYKIPYLYSVTDHLDALGIAGRVAHTVAVPGHGPRTDDLGSLIELNRSLVLDVAERVVEFTREPVTAETVLTKLLNHYQAVVSDAPAFYLLHPTVYAFLTHLERLGRVRHAVEGGQSLWQAI
jgi:glyoxylase-like metal-dependent hydrolase (beta-lactamase superfamily II)